MRGTKLVTLVWLGCASAAAAQSPSRFTLGPSLQVVHASFDGHTRGTLTVGGVTAGIRLSRALSIEGELTSPGRQLARSYEGTFISYVPGTPANPSAEEFARWAPIARRTLAFEPGFGGSGMLVARSSVRRHVTLAGRLGVSARRYVERSQFAVLAIPDGVDPARVARDFAGETHARIRGGVLAGGGADVAVTPRFSIAPQVRFVYSGPSRFGGEYRELGVAVGGHWRF